MHGPLAQLAEQLTLNQRVHSSSLWRLTHEFPVMARSNRPILAVENRAIASLLPMLLPNFYSCTWITERWWAQYGCALATGPQYQGKQYEHRSATVEVMR